MILRFRAFKLFTVSAGEPTITAPGIPPMAGNPHPPRPPGTTPFWGKGKKAPPPGGNFPLPFPPPPPPPPPGLGGKSRYV
ncbi:hypothetical protein CEC01302_24340 [Escherichia coli]|nr:hypothetical protein CEC01302_24340 [Escherichia coli]